MNRKEHKNLIHMRVCMWLSLLLPFASVYQSIMCPLKPKLSQDLVFSRGHFLACELHLSCSPWLPIRPHLLWWCQKPKVRCCRMGPRNSGLTQCRQCGRWSSGTGVAACHPCSGEQGLDTSVSSPEGSPDQFRLTVQTASEKLWRCWHSNSLTSCFLSSLKIINVHLENFSC